MLMIFDKNLVKLDIVWLSKKNISLIPWNGGSIMQVVNHVPTMVKLEFNIASLLSTTFDYI
jgi:hypothetical protein